MLSDDVEVRMVELIDHKEMDSIELMEITMEIFRKCEEVGIKLEFRNIGVVGLPFVIPFKKAKC